MTQITLGSVVVAAPRQVSSDLRGEAAILQLESGVYYTLNAVGARVWTLLQQPQRVDDDRLAAPGFTGQQVQAGMEADTKPVHYRVVFDYQLEEHFSLL